MSSNDGDRTVIIPTPGRRNNAATSPPPVSPRPSSPVPPPKVTSGQSSMSGQASAVEVSKGLNNLTTAATELIALLAELRHTISHPNPAQLRNSLIDQIKLFENKAQTAGQASEVVLSARYIICAALDESVLNTPWGPECGWAQNSLLSTFHNETAGGEKVFLILDRLLQTPAQYIDILELIYLCLSQGFEGKYKVDPRGHHQLEQIKENLYRAIEMQRGTFERALSVNWLSKQGGQQKVRDMVPMWVVFSIALLILSLSFSGFRWWLDHTTTPVATQLESLADQYDGKTP